MKHELISRKEALDRGMTTYYTGEPCKHGHLSSRKITSGSCSDCQNERTRKWRERKQNNEQDYEFKVKSTPDKKFLEEAFEYQDGILIWKTRPTSHFKSVKAWKLFNTIYAGRPAGHLNTRNFYLEVRIDNKLYKGHRLVWKLFNGQDAAGLIDHIDGDPTNNKIENLRVATIKENCQNGSKRKSVHNSTSRYKGVLLKDNKWYSIVTVDDISYLSCFKSEVEAAMDYDQRAISLFGEFARTNFDKKNYTERIDHEDPVNRE